MTNSSATTIVIFGASGDLTYRKLVPALFTLYCKGRLADDFQIVGFARSAMELSAFHAKMKDGLDKFARIDVSAEAWEKFSARLTYVAGSTTNVSGYETLKAHLETIEPETTNRLYYLSVPPRIFSPIVHNLYDLDLLNEATGWRRVVVEKPFGTDLASAQHLNAELHDVLEERQIYRIDHYLAKETVQNILVFRFGNTIFEPVWNRNYIQSVQITAAESVDVGHRAGYYDTSGVLRDMFQNHLLQLMTIIAMEPPASFSADAIRNEKFKVFSAIRPITAENAGTETIRGQYLGYRNAEGVAEKSQTATFAALRLYVDNWRWQGVPFYLRSGKALGAKKTEVTIQFKRPPHMMFPLPDNYEISSNLLSICIQPDEGMHLQVEAKVPDTSADMRSVNLEFHYSDSFAEDAIPEAYERLLLEALQGDASLFTRGDNIELAWRIVDPILAAWKDRTPPLEFYERGSWGPYEADRFIDQTGDEWTMGCGGHQ